MGQLCMHLADGKLTLHSLINSRHIKNVVLLNNFDWKPSNPREQMHWKLPAVLRQVALLRHGDWSHSLTSVSQRSPVQFAPHEHSQPAPLAAWNFCWLLSRGKKHMSHRIIILHSMWLLFLGVHRSISFRRRHLSALRYFCVSYVNCKREHRFFWLACFCFALH